MKRILFAFMLFTLSVAAHALIEPKVVPHEEAPKEPAGKKESVVECFVFAKLNDQDPNCFAIIGDETCAIAGKFRVLLDPVANYNSFANSLVNVIKI